MPLTAVRGVCDHADAEAQPHHDPTHPPQTDVQARGGVESII